MADKSFKPFTGTVDEYVKALGEHNLDCEACSPKGGPPRTSDDPRLCETGRKLRDGLAYARGRAAGRTGAKL